MIPLNPYTKRVVAKILNLCSEELGVSYKAENITGVRLIDGVAQVRVARSDRSFVIPFDAQQFRSMVESVRLGVIAALSTQEAWQRRRNVIAILSVICRLVSLVRFFVPRLRSLFCQVEEA